MSGNKIQKYVKLYAIGSTVNMSKRRKSEINEPALFLQLHPLRAESRQQY